MKRTLWKYDISILQWPIQHQTLEGWHLQNVECNMALFCFPMCMFQLYSVLWQLLHAGDVMWSLCKDYTLISMLCWYCRQVLPCPHLKHPATHCFSEHTQAPALKCDQSCLCFTLTVSLRWSSSHGTCLLDRIKHPPIINGMNGLKLESLTLYVSFFAGSCTWTSIY